MAESPNSQSRRHLVVSACGAVRGRKAHRHVDGGQLRGLHAGAAGRCTTWPTSCACKAGWCWPCMPVNLEHLDVQRLVVRQDFSMPLAIALVRDMRKQVDILNGQVTTQTEKAFDHSGR